MSSLEHDNAVYAVLSSETKTHRGELAVWLPRQIFPEKPRHNEDKKQLSKTFQQ